MHNQIKIILIICFSFFSTRVTAQYYGINIDYKTIEAMEAAYGENYATEAIHNENLKKILKSYEAAGVATAGIYTAKNLDRKALKNLNIFDSANENRYYTRIYKIVSRRIIPMVVADAELMVKDPSTALYWGGYLVRTCNDVKSLCSQFETIVTNSRLNFRDIAFVQIADELTSLFDLGHLGGVDWKNMFDHFGDDISGAFSTNSLKQDLETLITKGVGLANAGYENGVNTLLSGTSFDGTIEGKVGSVINLMVNAKSMYDEYKDLSALAITERLVGHDNINNLFNLSDYNVTNWISNYERSATGNFYTQRVYIYKREQNKEFVCNYVAPITPDEIWNRSSWYRIEVPSPNYEPSESELESIRKKSEAAAGWSQEKVTQLNQNEDGYNYNINYDLICYNKTDSSGKFLKSYAYNITVTKELNRKTEVHEEVYDSYSMDWNTFMAKMNVLMNQYNQDGIDTEILTQEDLQNYINSSKEDVVYQIGFDEKVYYQTTDAKKLEGATTATFTVTCKGGGELGSGTTQYKCDDCRDVVDDHTKNCSMLTTLNGSSFDTHDLEHELNLNQAKAQQIQQQIDILNQENSELYRKMAGMTAIEQEELRQQYNQNKDKLQELQSQLSEINDKIRQIKQAIDEAEESEAAQTDDYTRIPKLMKSMENAYGVTWSGSGNWYGNTFTRTGTIGNLKGTVTFKAELSIARKPQYFLGIKIHRAIVQIDWKMTSSYESSTIAEVLRLDVNKSEQENSEIVNAKLSELAQQNPGCQVTVEISKRDGIEEEPDEEVYHLLWASDRLEIARQIEARLSKIYVDLVLINKYMHYRYSITDWLQALAPKLNADKGKKLSIAEQSQRQWIINSGSRAYRREEESDSIR